MTIQHDIILLDLCAGGDPWPVLYRGIEGETDRDIVLAIIERQDESSGWKDDPDAPPYELEEVEQGRWYISRDDHPLWHISLFS